MKKVVLIMVSVLILTIFISFNYLLWYRGEQIVQYETDINEMEKSLREKQSVSASKIDDYIGQIFKQNQEIQSLGAQISSLKDDNSKLQQDYDQEVVNNNTKNAIIGKLKLQVDLEPLKVIIKNWVDFIDKARYEDAYRLLNNAPISQDAAKNLSEFANKFRNVKGINVKSVELLTEGLPENKKGDIIFKAVVDVTEVDDAATGELVKGSNYLYFNMSVREVNNEWGISSIPSTRLN